MSSSSAGRSGPHGGAKRAGSGDETVQRPRQAAPSRDRSLPGGFWIAAMMPRPTISIRPKARHARRTSPTRPVLPVGPFGSSNVSAAATEKASRSNTHSVAEPAVITQTQYPTLPITSNGRSRHNRKCLGRSLHDDGRCRPHQTTYSAFTSQIFSASLTLMNDKLILVVRLRKAEVGALRPAGVAIATGGRWSSWRSYFDFVPEPSESPRNLQSQAFCESCRWNNPRRCGAARGS